MGGCVALGPMAALACNAGAIPLPSFFHQVDAIVDPLEVLVLGGLTVVVRLIFGVSSR